MNTMNNTSMKLLKLLTLAGVLCAGLFTATAADKPAAKVTPGGGRLLEKTAPLAEVVIATNRTVTINFYSAEMKPIAATTQVVTAVASAKGGKATLEFEKKDNSLVSKTKLPEGEGYMLIVQFKQTTEAKPQNFRFKVDMHNCGGCDRAEYGCTCGH